MTERTHAENRLRQEMVEMMQRCKSEIVGLRAQLERLQPKAEAYDNLSAVLRLLPRQSLGASEDLAWVLERRIEKMKSEENAIRDDGASVASETEGA